MKFKRKERKGKKSKMKRKFSNKWKYSTKARKQRKYRFKAHLHIKHKFLNANLSKILRKRYHKRSFPLRKGDTVRVIFGTHKRKSGKIQEINLADSKVLVQGIQVSKRDGTKVNVPFHPSNLQITELVLEDKKRIKAIEKKLDKGKEKMKSKEKK